ncbi:MAG TPA: hypothetical protein VIF02_10645 [Methylocella sp.]|jgi:hypothetical protein
MILNKANSRGYDHVRLEIRNQMNSGMGVVDIIKKGAAESNGAVTSRA